MNWQVLKNAIAAGKTDCKIEFASQMWAARPHLGSIFEKLLHRKTFWLPRLDSYSKHAIVCFPSTTFSTSFEKMVETNKINNYI
ncbi:hypothetical protein [Ruminococcus sp.]|uniref:hypothetical protein n=1 Tax=Ruminococcus sp. TaxID=41978 RepID=UPI0039923CBB